MTRTVTACLAALLLLTGCAGESSPQQPALAVPQSSALAPAPSAYVDGAAAAQGLTPDQVLNRASFAGGTLGDQPFHGGQVLLWQPEPDRYRMRASLDLGNGQWRSTNATTDVMFSKAIPWGAGVALLNDVERSEQAVPLWVFYGFVNNPEIARVGVNIPGGQWEIVDVRYGTWLKVHQGVLSPGSGEVEVTAYSVDLKKITQTTIKLPPR